MKKGFILLIFVFSLFNVVAQNVWDAINKGDLDMVKRFVEKIGIDLSSKDDKGNSLIYRAIESNKIDIINYLIEKGAEIDGDSLLITIKTHNYEALKTIITKDFNFYTTITVTDYADNSYFTDKRRFQKILDALDYGGMDYLREYDSDFKKVKKTYNLIDYARHVTTSENIASIEFINNIKIQRLLIDKNKTVDKKLIISNPNINTYIIMGDLEEVKNCIKNGEGLNEYSYSVLFILDEDKLLNYFMDIEFVNKTNFKEILEQARKYNADKCFLSLIKRSDNVEILYTDAINGNDVYLSDIIRKEYPELSANIDNKIQMQKEEAERIKIEEEKERKRLAEEVAEKKRIEAERAEKIRQENYEIELERKKQIEKEKRLCIPGIVVGAVFLPIGLVTTIVGFPLGIFAISATMYNRSGFEDGVASAILLGSAALFFSIGFPVLIHNGKKLYNLKKQTNLEIGLFNDNLYVCLSTKF